MGVKKQQIIRHSITYYYIFVIIYLIKTKKTPRLVNRGVHGIRRYSCQMKLQKLIFYVPSGTHISLGIEAVGKGGYPDPVGIPAGRSMNKLSAADIHSYMINAVVASIGIEKYQIAGQQIIPADTGTAVIFLVSGSPLDSDSEMPVHILGQT